MPNRNYLRGTRFERQCRKDWLSFGCQAASRTAGSHGLFDLYMITSDGHLFGSQCKVVTTEAQAKALIQAFEKHPPVKGAKFVQVLEVYTQATRAKSMTWIPVTA